MFLHHQEIRKFFLIQILVAFWVVGCQDQKKLPETVPPQVENRSETKTDVEKNKFSAPVERTQKIEKTINGTYIYDGSDAKCKISVFGDQWVGSFSVVSGFGDEYDASQAEFQTGVVRSNEIFDESGLVKIGYIEEKNLTTTVGGQYITLKRKN